MSAATLDAVPEEKSVRRPQMTPDGETVTPGEDITELEKFEPERVDGVGTPANGFPVLMMKSISEEQAESEGATAPGDTAAKAKGGKKKKMPRADEQGFPGADAEKDAAEPASEEDAAAKEAESHAAYDAARSEWISREPAAAKSALTGTEYLQQQVSWKRWYAEGDELGLNGTSDGYSRWAAKQAAPGDPEAPAGEDLLKAEAAVYKRDIDTATRQRLASEHKALPDGSYPIESKGDLDNAAVLARSGHGNVAGAKRLISRRAKELGVANPLKDETAKAGKIKVKDKKMPCGTCKGTGKIRGGGMNCPDCKGSGKMKPAAAKDAAFTAVQDEIAKAVAVGTITREAAEKLLAEVDKARAQRDLPPEVKPAGKHREPDGTTTIEQLEPQAGLGTDPDKTADKIPPSVAAMGKDAAPYSVARMHDATCAAYDAGDVIAEYPALKGVADAVDPAWWRKRAAEAVVAGRTKKAEKLIALGAAADLVKDADPAAVADGHAFLHKSFTDMYPNEHCSPSAPPMPGKYQRPYISGGHASDEGAHRGTVAIPSGEHVPEPQQFQRGPITAGHESPSPASTPGHDRVDQDSPTAGRSYYTNAARDQARTALAAMHDHIAQSFPDLCPMASTKAVLPPSLGAKNVPQAITPKPQGGAIKAAGTTVTLEWVQDEIRKLREQADARPASGEPAALKAASLQPALTVKMIRKEVRKALRAGQPAAAAADVPVPADATALGILLAEQIAPLTERYDTQLAEIRKEIGELGSQPDPALAPLRGAIARASGAVPVERRSLVDEARQAEAKKAASEQAAYREYVTALSRSPDPGTREKALSVLDNMSAAA